MAIIQEVRGFTPKIAHNVFLATNATVVGDVEIGEGSSIWSVSYTHLEVRMGIFFRQ